MSQDEIKKGKFLEFDIHNHMILKQTFGIINLSNQKELYNLGFFVGKGLTTTTPCSVFSPASN